MSQVMPVGPIVDDAMSAEVGCGFVVDGWSLVVVPVSGKRGS